VSAGKLRRMSLLWKIQSFFMKIAKFITCAVVIALLGLAPAFV